jgi:Tat protein translocase TatB subunit
MKEPNGFSKFFHIKESKYKMFGLGMPEILMILAIALIVIGPKKLPDLAKTLGRAMGEFKRSAQDFKRSIDVETTVKDIKDVADPKIDLQDIIKDANKKKEAPPAPADEKTSDHGPVDPYPGQESSKVPEENQPDKTPNPAEQEKSDTP